MPFLVRNNATFGVRMTWDLFDWGKRSSSRGEKESELAQALENVERLKKRTAVRVEKSYRDVKLAGQMMETARSALYQAQENSRLGGNRYAVGLSLFLGDAKMKTTRRDFLKVGAMSNTHLRRALQILATLFWAVADLFAQPAAQSSSSTSIFSPVSTPADSIFGLSLFVLAVTGVIFVIVCSLLVYSAVKFRRRADDDGREPPQVYGSNQLELAWTVIPVLIVVVLFLASARVIHEVQDAPRPPGAIEVTVVGHQFWWEYRYPSTEHRDRERAARAGQRSRRTRHPRS